MCFHFLASLFLNFFCFFFFSFFWYLSCDLTFWSCQPFIRALPVSIHSQTLQLARFELETAGSAICCQVGLTWFHFISSHPHFIQFFSSSFSIFQFSSRLNNNLCTNRTAPTVRMINIWKYARDERETEREGKREAGKAEQYLGENWKTYQMGTWTENREWGTGPEARHLLSGLGVCALIIGQTALNFQVFTEAKQNTNKMQQ